LNADAILTKSTAYIVSATSASVFTYCVGSILMMEQLLFTICEPDLILGISLSAKRRLAIST